MGEKTLICLGLGQERGPGETRASFISLSETLKNSVEKQKIVFLLIALILLRIGIQARPKLFFFYGIGVAFFSLASFGHYSNT